MYRETPSYLNKYMFESKRPYETLNRSYQKYDQSPVRKQYLKSKPLETAYRSHVEPLSMRQSVLPNYEPTKCSSGRNGIIKAYAANTNQGIVREYNEDRVSIILNIVKPQSRSQENWPKCSFFGVYDGHGGAACADFLRDNLHQFVIREPDFPWNPIGALKKGFEAAEKHFLGMALDSYTRGVPERSGSCAIVSLIVGDTCYVANVGDSRGILSSQGGRKVIGLSQDHKPELEQERIQRNGGKIYQTQAINEDGEQIIGPFRVFPGRLSVSRTFGDIEAKLERFGGNSKVVISDPDIQVFKITSEHDFIVMGSDGIYDKMNSSEVINTIWQELHRNKSGNLHASISIAVESVLQESIMRKSSDNVTMLLVAFSTTSEESEFRMPTAGSVERYIDHKQQQLPKFKNDENNPVYVNSQRQFKHPQQQFKQSQQIKRIPIDDISNRIRASYIF